MPENGENIKRDWRILKLEERADQLGERDRTLEEAQRWLAEAGAKHNEQIKTHDKRLDAHDEAIAEERREREGFNSKVLWLLVSFAFSLAGAAVAFALGVIHP